MKKTRWIAGAMALTLLAGCSSAADPNDLAYQTADVKRDSELLTVDGVGVPAEEYLFWLSNAIYQEKNYGGLADDSAWQETLWDGSNTTEALKAEDATLQAEIEALLAGGESDPQKIMELSDEYGKVKDSIDEMEMRWLELQEIIGA